MLKLQRQEIPMGCGYAGQIVRHDPHSICCTAAYFTLGA